MAPDVELGEEATIEPRGGIAADDISFIKKVVLAGGGIALLPAFFCAREIHSHKLIRVLPGWQLGGSLLHVVYPSARYVPHRVLLLRDYLVEQLGKLSKTCSERAASEPPPRSP